jgi:nucleoid-associated protein YgaU
VRPRRATLAAAAVALALLIVLLGVLGRGRMAAPPVGSWVAMTRWYAAIGPDGAAVAGLRLIALLLAMWVLLATVLQLIGSLPWLAPVRAVADLISPRSLQRLGHGLAGLSLTAGLAAPAPSVGTPAGEVAPTAAAGWFVVAGDEPPLPPAPPASPAWPTPGTATMHLLEPPAAVAPSAAPMADAVTVTAGDSLWSLAADEVAARRGATASEREVARYWRQVVAANRSVLVDPTNPDLIYAGQVVTLPVLA